MAYLHSHSTFSVVLDVRVQIRELGMFQCAIRIRQNSFSQGQAFFDHEKHLYSCCLLSLIGLVQLLICPVYPYDLGRTDFQFDHRFLSVSVSTISFALRFSGGVWLSKIL
jgi:hypothetical protein